MTDLAKLTCNQERALKRFPERAAALKAAFERLNVRDREMAIKIGLTRDGVDVGDGWHKLGAP